MERIYKGKTKDVYLIEGGNYLLRFKDDATGEGGVFDPGANQVGLSIEGMGNMGVRVSAFLFEKIEAAGIATHYVSADFDNSEMVVKPAEIFGNGIEVICRYKATGSFVRRYGMYAAEGRALDALVEITLKDDERNDPLITKEALDALNILTCEEYDQILIMTREICQIVKDEFSRKGAELYDIKLEFGKADGKIHLIDEISAGSMRVYKDGKKLEPPELANLLLGN